MARYVVLKHDGEMRDARVRVLRDHFSIIALAFPLPWLLFNRLWLEALTAFLVMIAIGLLASQLPTIGVSLVSNLALGALVGLEGERWAISRAKRMGFREIGSISDAANLEEAELRAFHAFGTDVEDVLPSAMIASAAREQTEPDMFFGRA